MSEVAPREVIGELEEVARQHQCACSAAGGGKREIKPLWNSELKGGGASYILFLESLLSRRVIVYRLVASDEVGIFLVRKKNGRLRLFLDARSPNAKLNRPSRTHLASTAALVEFHPESDEELVFSIHDVADCYYQFRLPDYLVNMFGLKPVLAGDVGIASVEGSSTMRRAVASTLRNVGLPLHEVEDDKSLVTVLGIELDGIQHRVRMTDARRVRLTQALRAAVRRRQMSGREVGILVGHVTHTMLLNRPALAAFIAVYDFALKADRCVRLLWPSVRRELRIALGLLLFMVVRWRLPWCGVSIAAMRRCMAMQRRTPLGRPLKLGLWVLGLIVGGVEFIHTRHRALARLFTTLSMFLRSVHST
jgi:hypothetical protein